MVLPFKRNFDGRTFTRYCLFLRILQIKRNLEIVTFVTDNFYLIICKTIETTILNSNKKLDFSGPLQ